MQGFVTTAILGLVFTATLLVTGSLWAGMIYHAATDLSLLLYWRAKAPTIGCRINLISLAGRAGSRPVDGAASSTPKACGDVDQTVTDGWAAIRAQFREAQRPMCPGCYSPTFLR
jgi:hypothetical protein